MSGPNFRGAAPTGTPTSGGGTFVDGQGHVHYTTTLAEARKAAGFGTLLDKVGDVAPYAIMAGMGYGALANAGVFGAAAAGHGATAAGPAVNWAAAPSASHLFAPTALVGTAAPAASTAAATGAGTGMFGLGSLANFFNSRGGEAAINAGVNLIGGRLQANAYNRSADVQAQAAREALAFEQEQYRAAQADYNAWLHGGPMARLDELIAAGRGSGAPGSTAPAVNTTMPVGGPSMSLAQMRSAGSGQTPGAQQPGMVSLLAPDRSTVRQFVAGDPKLTGHLQRGWTKV